MNTASTLPGQLSPVQGRSLAEIVGTLEFLPISCLFCRGDEFRVISPGRVIPDDFIYLPTKGALECTVGGERRVVAPGAFIMVPAGLPHGAVMAEGVREYEVFSLHMHLYDASRYRFLEKLDSHFGSLADLEGWVANLAACTCLMGRDPKAGSAFMKQLVTRLLIDQLLGGRTLRELPSKTDQRVARLLGRIRAAPAEDWTVTRMAEQCHLSVSRFRQLFTACTGTSPKKYVQNVRLSLARSLLLTTPELTVEQVASKVGVPDAHYFHAIYKQRFGETPRQRAPFREA